MAMPVYQPDPLLERDTILQSDRIMLWHYPRLKMLHHQMLQPPSSAEFRELLAAGADIVDGYSTSKWLSDDRGNTVLREEDELWADTVWLPRVLKAGFKYWAIVLPAAAIGQLNMRRLAAQHARRGIISRIEAEPFAAFEWLKAQ